MYISPEMFVKNTSGDTKKRKMPSIYYTRENTKTISEIQKIQKSGAIGRRIEAAIAPLRERLKSLKEKDDNTINYM